MKIILAGATGRIGGATLKRLLSLPNITTVFALTRREIPGIKQDPKLQTIILKDFTSYSDETLSQLAGAEACIWALGAPTAGQDVHMDLTFAAADAFAQSLLPKLDSTQKPFRFVYVSGAAVEQDQEKFLLFLSETRKMRGKVEARILDYQQSHAPDWQTILCRPGAVHPGYSFWRQALRDLLISDQVLGAALAHLAVNGGSEKHKWENRDLLERGQHALERMK